jgi:hypothetical protein
MSGDATSAPMVESGLESGDGDGVGVGAGVRADWRRGPRGEVRDGEWVTVIGGLEWEV